MRIAFLADIHGNLPAFEAALAHIQAQRVDQLIIVGDIVVGAPDSAACWRLAQALGVPIIRGNHERYVATFDAPDAPAIWRSEQFGPVQWAYQQFTPEERAALDALPLHLRLPEFPDLLIVHSSLCNDRDQLVAYTPDDEIAGMFPGIVETTIVRAHNHVAAVRLWSDRTIITTGATGLPLDLQPTAQYLILEQRSVGWHIQHQSVPYDVEASLRRFRDSGYLESAGPMARLCMREVATAAGHIVPFLHAYARWSAASPLPLDQAVARFLASV